LLQCRCYQPINSRNLGEDPEELLRNLLAACFKVQPASVGVRGSGERRSTWRWKHTVVAWEAEGSGLNVAGARHMVRKSDRYVNDYKGLAASSQAHKRFEGWLHLEIQTVFVDVG
jgi:hypothetical protein